MSVARKTFDLYRATWGCLKSSFGSMTMEEFLPAVKSLGYKGIEIPFVLALDYDAVKLMDKVEEYDLKLIFQLFSDGPMAPGFLDWQNSDNIKRYLSNNDGMNMTHPIPNDSDIDTHITVLQKQIEHALSLFNKNQRCVKLNCHSLRDFHTISEANEFFTHLIPFQESILKENKDVECILHETHRKRFFHSPWMCRDFINFIESDNSNVGFDESKLVMTADLSHFTCVAETDPNSHAILSNVINNQLAKRIKHIHGRIGYDHGPQVNDPRAPEWSEYVSGFENWWDNIISESMSEKNENDGISISYTPEHGPPNYQQTAPYTQEPLADIWEVNTWIGNKQQQRFNQKYGNNVKNN